MIKVLIEEEPLVGSVSHSVVNEGPIDRLEVLESSLVRDVVLCSRKGLAVANLDTKGEPSLSDLWVWLTCAVQICVNPGCYPHCDFWTPCKKPVKEDNLQLGVGGSDVVLNIGRRGLTPEGDIGICKSFKLVGTCSGEIKDYTRRVGATLLHPGFPVNIGDNGICLLLGVFLFYPLFEVNLQFNIGDTGLNVGEYVVLNEAPEVSGGLHLLLDVGQELEALLIRNIREGVIWVGTVHHRVEGRVGRVQTKDSHILPKTHVAELGFPQSEIEIMSLRADLSLLKYSEALIKPQVRPIATSYIVSGP